jgi:hypothetical protein
LKKNDYDWEKESGFGEFEKRNNTEIDDDILTDSYEALSRFYQKENRRSKTVKQKRNCWQ